MATFREVRNSILSDLNRTAANDLTAAAETEIRTAIAFYEKRRFWFLEARATTVTQAGQEYYVLPEDFRDDDSLVIAIDTFTYPLEKRSYEQIEHWADSNTRGQPTDYAIYDQQIRLYPKPDDAYTLTLSYVKQLSDLSNEDHTNEWMVEGEGLIRSRVEWTLFARKVKDFDAAQAAKVLEEEELSQHEKLTRARLMTGYGKRRAM